MHEIDLGSGDRAFWDSYWDRWYPRKPITTTTTAQSIPSQPIASWTEEQLRAFVAQEVAKALREIKAPPILKYERDEEALREKIANAKDAPILLCSDTAQIAPNEEIMQAFEDTEPEYSETNRKLAEM